MRRLRLLGALSLAALLGGATTTLPRDCAAADCPGMCRSQANCASSCICKKPGNNAIGMCRPRDAPRPF